MYSDFFYGVLASASAGLIGRLVCHPIDTIKAKLQANYNFKGVADVVKTTYIREGARGFYQGLGTVLVGGIPGVCIYLTTYETCKMEMQKRKVFGANDFGVYFSCGMLAEAVCCVVFVPVDVVKERLQVQSNRQDLNYKGNIDAFRTIFKEEGLRGIYKGYGATLLSFGPYSALYFLFYEKCKEFLIKSRVRRDNSTLQFLDNLKCAAIAGTAASILTNPLDLAKLTFQIQRIKVQNASDSKQIIGIFDAFRHLYISHGIKGLFRGSLARVMFNAPSSAITMACYEECKLLWKKIL